MTVTFKIGTDLNFAQVLVQNRVSTVLSSLPDAVQSQGVTVEKKSTSILQIVALTSPNARFDSLYLSNYATLRLKDEIARLPGVGSVNVFGAGQYAMRVWLDPEKMKARSLNVTDVINSLQQQNEQVTAGQIGTPPAPASVSFQYTLNVAGRLDDPKQFANVIVKTGSSGQITRLKDIGRVELGAQTYSQVFSFNGKPAAGLAIFQSPGANALDVASEVKKRMDALSKSFPQGLTYDIPFDTTVFVKASIDEVYKTLIEAGDPGADRDPGVPAGLARHAGAGDHGAGHDYRRFRRHVGDGFHDQFRHAVRHRSGDRHRGRRRHYRGGRRGA